MSRVLVAVLWLCADTPQSRAQDPYRFYGGEVEGKATNAAIEACQYRELIEKRRCNASMNKSRCFEDLHEECRQRFSSQEDDAVPDDPSAQPEKGRR